MNISEADGKILYDLIIKYNYKRALEIGTSTNPMVGRQSQVESSLSKSLKISLSMQHLTEKSISSYGFLN